MTKEELEQLLTRAAGGHPHIYGVDPSAFSLDVEHSSELPVVGYFETARAQVDAYGTASPIYEIYVFYDNKFRYERKEVDAAQIDAANLLRKVINRLASYAVGAPSSFRKFDGGAFGGISCTLCLNISTACDEIEPECTEADYPATDEVESAETSPIVVIDEDQERDRYCRYGELEQLTIVVNYRAQYETSIEFASGETATRLVVLGEYRHVGDMTILPATSYLIAVKGGIMVMGEIITEAI